MSKLTTIFSIKITTVYSLILLFIATGCYDTTSQQPQGSSSAQQGEKKNTAPSGPPPIQVEVRRLQLRPFRVMLSTSGTARPDRQSVLASAVSGLASEVNIHEGQEVKKDEILLKIDSALWQAKKKEAQAECRRLQAQLKEMQRGYLPEEIAETQANVEEIQANLKSLAAELDRNRDLFERTDLAATEWDKIRYSYQSMQARYRKAQAELALRKQGFREEKIQAVQASLEKAQAQLAQAEYSLAQTKVKAPYDGVIIQKGIEKGEWVKPETEIATIADIDQIKVEVFIAEKLVPFVTLGIKTEILIDALPGKKIAGEVSEFIPQAVGGRNFPVRILVPNEDHAIKVGMFCRVFAILKEEEQAPVIHIDSIVRRKDGTYVIRVSPNKQAEMIRVALGERQGEWYEVLESEKKLSQGDLLVVTNNELVYPQANARITREYP